MPNDSNATKRQTEAPAISQPEGQVMKALEALRLLTDQNNPLSLRQAISRARELAETYRRWEQDGALIKDIVVRLPDGQEIAMEQSKAASLCGFHFRELFPPDAVLHVWKKADDKFGEVQLLSLALRDVGANGYSYKRTYKNGQTLSLKVERCADDQFHISVDCAAKQQEASLSRKLRGWLPLLAPAVMALSGLTSFLRGPRPRYAPHWALRPGAAFGAGVLVSMAACLLLTLSATGGGPNEVQNVSPVAMEQSVPAPWCRHPGDAGGQPASATNEAELLNVAGAAKTERAAFRASETNGPALKRASLTKTYTGAAQPTSAANKPAASGLPLNGRNPSNLATLSPGVPSNFTEKQIRELPLLVNAESGGRSPLSFIFLDPEAAPASAAASVTATPQELAPSERRAGVVIRYARGCGGLVAKGLKFLMPRKKPADGESDAASYGTKYREEAALRSGSDGQRERQRYVPGGATSAARDGVTRSLLSPSVSVRSSYARPTGRVMRGFAN